jgi:hypothetical protein
MYKQAFERHCARPPTFPRSFLRLCSSLCVAQMQALRARAGVGVGVSDNSLHNLFVLHRLGLPALLAKELMGAPLGTVEYPRLCGAAESEISQTPKALIELYREIIASKSNIGLGESGAFGQSFASVTGDFGGEGDRERCVVACVLFDDEWEQILPAVLANRPSAALLAALRQARECMSFDVDQVDFMSVIDRLD